MNLITPSMSSLISFAGMPTAETAQAMIQCSQDSVVASIAGGLACVLDNDAESDWRNESKFKPLAKAVEYARALPLRPGAAGRFAKEVGVAFPQIQGALSVYRDQFIAGAKQMVLDQKSAYESKKDALLKKGFIQIEGTDFFIAEEDVVFLNHDCKTEIFSTIDKRLASQRILGIKSSSHNKFELLIEDKSGDEYEVIVGGEFYDPWTNSRTIYPQVPKGFSFSGDVVTALEGLGYQEVTPGSGIYVKYEAPDRYHSEGSQLKKTIFRIQDSTIVFCMTSYGDSWQ